ERNSTDALAWSGVVSLEWGRSPAPVPVPGGFDAPDEGLVRPPQHGVRARGRKVGREEARGGARVQPDHDGRQGRGPVPRPPVQMEVAPGARGGDELPAATGFPRAVTGRLLVDRRRRAP